MHSLSNPKQTY